MTLKSTIPVTGDFSLAETCGPVAWGGGRWPNQDWIDGRLIAVSRDSSGVIIRQVHQPAGYGSGLAIESNRDDVDHSAWARSILGTDRVSPQIEDPVVLAIADRFPGMRPFSNGTLFDGIVTAIIGQSISVQAAAVTERKLAELYSAPIVIKDRPFWPAPTLDQLSNSDPAAVRKSGVTQRRADAIVEIAHRFSRGDITEPKAAMLEDDIYASVLALPQVGRWTAESVLLWGLGSDDSYPIGDVALLRAARLAYADPIMTHAAMDAISDTWRPGRSWASRWLWLNLFGPAPM